MLCETTVTKPAAATAGLIIKEIAGEMPPPGAGFTTVTGTLAAMAMSAAVMAAISCVELPL